LVLDSGDLVFSVGNDVGYLVFVELLVEGVKVEGAGVVVEVIVEFEGKSFHELFMDRRKFEEMAFSLL
jgi:hypothetical protein